MIIGTKYLRKRALSTRRFLSWTNYCLHFGAICLWIGPFSRQTSWPSASGLTEYIERNHYLPVYTVISLVRYLTFKYIDYSHMRLVARSVSTCDKRRHLAYNRIESLEGAPIGCRRRICNRSWSQLDVWKCWEKPQIIISWFLSWSSFSISFHHFPLFNGHKLGRTPLVTQIRPAEAWWIFGAAVTSWIAWIWGGCHQISPDLHN
jgi:hypothetical protein